MFIAKIRFLADLKEHYKEKKYIRNQKLLETC